MKRFALLLPFLVATPLAAQDLVFDAAPLLACEAQSDDPVTCLGLAAQGCIENTLGGPSTVVSGACLWAEHEYWDDRLNGAYQALLAVERQRDLDNEALALTLPSLAESLREMQRAWVTYRDAACAYERAQWGGGTGQGPADAACRLELTGQQALKLEAQLTGLRDQ